MAEGTKRLAGVDSNYIIEILHGKNSQPFQCQISGQINCIKDELTEMQNEIKTAKNFTQLFKKGFKVPQSKVLFQFIFSSLILLL